VEVFPSHSCSYEMHAMGNDPVRACCRSVLFTHILGKSKCYNDLTPLADDGTLQKEREMRVILVVNPNFELVLLAKPL
jgi:hypothetical protein